MFLIGKETLRKFFTHELMQLCKSKTTLDKLKQIIYDLVIINHDAVEVYKVHDDLFRA